MGPSVLSLFEPDNIVMLAHALERSVQRAGLRDEVTASSGPTAPAADHAFRELV